MKTTLGTSTALSAVVALATFALMTSCGSKSSPRSDLPVGGESISPGTGAQCNYFNSNQTRLGGRVMSYSSNGVVQEEKSRVRITTLDPAFDSSTAFSVKFFRMRSNSSGTLEIDQTPLTFYIENGSGQVISGALTSLNSTTASSLRSYAPGSGTSSSEFYNATSVQITGVDYSYQALKVVLYNGSTTAGEANFLIPVFTANPNTYATSHSATLNGLHPFWADRANAHTDAQWVQLSQANCF